MLSVILIWSYMAATCYLTGYAALKIIIGKTGYQIRHGSSYLYAGLVTMTVYAQLFSLFYKVGMAAQMVLVAISALLLFFFRRELLGLCYAAKNQFRTSKKRLPAYLLLLLGLLLFFAYGTANGYQHYDTGLYHAQSIRWIEEYGVIKGLGNLHSRLAYNSSAFALTALYSFKWLTGQSYHVCSGFMAFLLAVTCIERLFPFKRGGIKLSDFVRVLAVYYLLNIFDEMISPASDYFMVLTVFFLLIRWLELSERQETSYAPYGLLCILTVFIVTVKLSGALLLLLTIRPAVAMIRERKWQDIGKNIGAGLLTALPFFIRNVLLSGWLLYPFTALDLFELPYKIPKGMAEYDAREIQVFGRGYHAVAEFGKPFAEWFPAWVQALDRTDQLCFVLAVLGILFLPVLFLIVWKQKQKEEAPFLFLMLVLAICFLFWLLTAPLIRYGCVFLWAFPVITWGFLYLKISPHVDKYRLSYLVLLLFAAYKLFAFGKEIGTTATGEYLLTQKEYESFEVIPYELHGVTFYYPVSGDRTGYDAFPGAPVQAEDIFLGDRLEDGFKDVIHP